MSEKRIRISQSGIIILVLVIKLSLTVLFTSCGNKVKEEVRSLKDEKKESGNTPKNESGSDQKKSELKYYFPLSVSNEKNTSNADTSRLSSFSSTMLRAGEPVLYSFEKSSPDIIRLLQFNGFDKCIIISLNKDGDKIWLRKKILSRAAFLKPQAGGNFVPALNSDGSIDSTKGINYEEFEMMTDIHPKPEILSNTKTEQTQSIWDSLISCLKGSGYYDMPSYINIAPQSKKAVFWLMESRVGLKYHIVERPDAGGEFRKCCDFLLGLNSK